jgi:hypothetical protein
VTYETAMAREIEDLTEQRDALAKVLRECVRIWDEPDVQDYQDWENRFGAAIAVARAALGEEQKT